MSYIFEEIDREGLEALQAEGFVKLREMLFRKSVYDPTKVEAQLAAGRDGATIQYQMNHQSLISYGGNIEQQRGAANLIASRWIERLAKEYPQLYPTVIVELTPDEVIISLRSVARQKLKSTI
ncbi:MAG: hypothetical protein WAL75_24560 [Terracidiphilus sp.]